MTRDEAIRILFSIDNADEMDEEFAEAYNMAIQALKQKPCEMTTEEYRQRMVQAFQNANCEELIALCVLPTEKEFEHLEWLLKRRYKKEPCEKIDSAIKEMKALADPKNTTLGFDEKMGLKVAINILLRNSGYAPDTNVGGKKVEELRMEKHTDRQIYDGCIHLMQKMVDYFREYLEYIGYNFDEQEEDERFAIEMLNMEIVRQLFLNQTRNSGGCSTRDFCEKLGVDPYKSVKFEFEESEEA